MEAVQAGLDADTILRDVPAHRPRYEDGWDGTYKSRLSRILDDLDDETLEVICELLGIDIDSDGLKSKILEQQSQAVTLYTLHRFISDKQTLLREMAERNGDDVNTGAEFRYLLQRISSGNPDIVYQLLLYSEWSDAKNRRTYEIENSLPDDYTSRFNADFLKISMTLARRMGSGKFIYEKRNMLKFANATIFAIDRQTSDRERRDVVGAQRRRNLRSVFVEVDEDEELIYISTNNQTIRATLVEKLEEIFSVSLANIDAVQNQMELDAEQFGEALLESQDEGEDNIKIVNVDFKRTEITPSLPLAVSKKSYGTEVRSIVSALAEDIIEPSILNVRKFWFNVYDVDARVQVDVSNDEDLLRLDSKINTDSTYRSDRIRRRFEDQFGVPLDRDIPLHWVTGDRQQVISYILKNPPTYETQNILHQDLIEDLEELSVINTRPIERKQCQGQDCEKIFTGYDGETCTSCGGKLTVFAERQKVTFSDRGVLEFFKQRLADEGLEYLETKVEQIYRTEYRFRRVRHEGDIVHVLINTPEVSIPQKSINHLSKSVNPVTVLNPGTVKNQQLMEEVLATYIDLSELIDLHLNDDLPDDYLTEKIETVARATEERTARNARDAYHRLQDIVANPANHRGEHFEIEVFHLINQMITNSEQWGTKRRGNLPDGFAELLYKTNRGNNFRSFAWDGKFTASNELNIDAAEANNLRTYAHKIKDSTDVTSSDTRFKNFVVVTNADPGNFETTVAERLNKMTSWDGIPVLMHIDFLIALHLGFNANVDRIKRHLHEFYKQFYLALNGGNFYYRDIDDEFYVHLDAKDAEALLENFEENTTGSSLDINSLREFMESDIFP